MKPCGNRWDWLEERRTFWLALGLGTAARLAVALLLNDVGLFADSFLYHRVAKDLVSGLGPDFVVYPVLPLYLSGFQLVFGCFETVSRLAMIPLWVGFALSGRGLVGELTDRRTANLFLILFCFYPLFVIHSVEPLTQLPTALCLIWVCRLAIRAVRDGNRGAMWGLGVLLGVTTLLRSSSILLVPAVPLVVGILRREPSAAVRTALPALLIVGGWILYASLATGDFVFINYSNMYNFFYGNNPYTPIYETGYFATRFAGDPGIPEGYARLWGSIRALPVHLQGQDCWRAVLGHVVDRPDLFLLRTLSRLRMYFAFPTDSGSILRSMYGAPVPVYLACAGLDAVIYIGFAGAAITALFAGVGRRLGAKALPIILTVTVVYALPFFVSLTHPTYNTAIQPLLAVLGLAWLTGGDRLTLLRENPRRRRWLYVALAVFLLVQVEWLIFTLRNL
jgi:4-amino-4-deoxy-L-arabinose transferase-like glycosyltransferase